VEAALLAVILALVALLGGCLWYVLNRLGSRLDTLDGRLRGVEEAMTRTSATVQSMNDSVRSILDKVQDAQSRLSFLEGQNQS